MDHSLQNQLLQSGGQGARLLRNLSDEGRVEKTDGGLSVVQEVNIIVCLLIVIVVLMMGVADRMLLHGICKQPPAQHRYSVPLQPSVCMCMPVCVCICVCACVRACAHCFPWASTTRGGRGTDRGLV